MELVKYYCDQKPQIEIEDIFKAMKPLIGKLYYITVIQAQQQWRTNWTHLAVQAWTYMDQTVPEDSYLLASVTYVDQALITKYIPLSVYMFPSIRILDCTGDVSFTLNCQNILCHLLELLYLLCKTLTNSLRLLQPFFDVENQSIKCNCSYVRTWCISDI